MLTPSFVCVFLATVAVHNFCLRLVFRSVFLPLNDRNEPVSLSLLIRMNNIFAPCKNFTTYLFVGNVATLDSNVHRRSNELYANYSSFKPEKLEHE